MKHSTPFADGLENGIIGDNASWVHYNWPEDASSVMQSLICHIAHEIDPKQGFHVDFRRDGYPQSLPNFTMFGVYVASAQNA